MTWEERLLFLMFMDYKGALKKWEMNHNKQPNGSKIDSASFNVYAGFSWSDTSEGDSYWNRITSQWLDIKRIKANFRLHEYEIRHDLFSNTIKVGCQTITKKDALKIADFIYECFGEKV